ncbi:MAG TPA: (2Fe-2S) ferredoxin domain-containing protein [Nitrospinaceae bacterium]|jgi:(2Fe-2S) ferredoxin|nr:(2Fe-2S) ferredoxin domain-containing protein [Nitrospinaceae bacterium]HJL72902.1 (2Fe-2S) ferredoxin domain-containing protein [Nitrospinaceae bacterium]HJO00430.1 (2Fe-2S) ferredoxin domain-containing protein [Nitrospinaceae bacterium]|tara:strand:- start:4631 stop:4957 length:327 start_codon:yes stop_codon:yes gene_type:complete
MSRFQKHLFICNNKRTDDDPRGSCFACGADNLLDYAKGRIHEMGLKGKVRVNKAGCLDACAHGPAMVVYPDDVWYSPQTKEDMEEIITEHVRDNRVARRLAIEFKKKA